MIGRWMRRIVEVDKGIADGVAEGVVHGAAALVEDGALVERNGVAAIEQGICGREAAEGEEEGQQEGGDGGGDDGAQEIQQLHL